MVVGQDTGKLMPEIGATVIVGEMYLVVWLNIELYLLTSQGTYSTQLPSALLSTDTALKLT